MQPVEITTKPEVVSAFIEGGAKTAVHSSTDRNAKLLKETHIEKSLCASEEQQLGYLITEFYDVFALESSELGTTDCVTHVIDTTLLLNSIPAAYLLHCDPKLTN